MATVETGKRVDLGQFESADRKLHRSMSLTQLLLLGVSAQIGSGWLFAVLSAAGIAGPAAVLSWIIAAVLVGLIALTYAELGSMLPRSGAIVRYTYLSHGSFAGWIIGWAYWLSAVTIPPLEAIAVLTYLGGKFPETHFLQPNSSLLAWPNGILAGVALMAIFFLLNFFGAKFLSESNRWVTLWKIALPTATFCGLFVVLNGSNFTAYGGFTATGVAPIFHAIATSGIIFALLGFRQALDYGGESRNPQRDVPLATWGSIVIPTIIYTLLQVGFIGAIKWNVLGIGAGHWGHLSKSNWANGPLFHALNSAGIAGLATLGTLLIVDAAISPGATGWVYLGTATRCGYGLGVHRNIPPVFQANNRFGIPWVALAVSVAVGCVFFVPSPSWYTLVSFISAAAVMTYIMGGAGLPVLRKHAAELPRPFRLRGFRFWSPIGFLAAALILYWSGFTTLANVFTAALIGMPLFCWYYAWHRGWMPKAPAIAVGVVFLGLWIWIAYAGGWVLTPSGTQRPGGWGFGVYDGAFSAAFLALCVAMWWLSNTEGRRHILASAWLVWLILAFLPLSYFGHYGPLAHPPLAFPWGTVVAVGVGLVTQFWAARSGFETEEMRDIVDTYRRGGDVGEALAPE